MAVDVTNNSKPIQTVSWEKKISNKKEWFKKSADYYISMSRTKYKGKDGDYNRRDLKVLYDVYNNQFPLGWFSHVTDPLSAKNPNHKAFPAKVRPVTILRTNLDLLMAEYPRRPFIYQVNNMGDDGYNRYTDGLKQKINQNLQQYFQLALQQQMMEQGYLDASGKPVSEEAQAYVQQQMENIPYPADIKKTFDTSYRDKIAIKAQKWLDRALVEHHIKQCFQRQIKDWMITGESYSYKAVEYGNLVYKRRSPLYIDYDRSDDIQFIEDGEWVTYLDYQTISDIVDEQYEYLDKDSIDKMESGSMYATPESFAVHLQGSSLSMDREAFNKVPVWHVVWKGKKKVGVVYRIDPETGEPQELEVDENYIPDKSIGETVEWMWVNEAYEATRIGQNLYTRMRPVPLQRNAMNNYSKCKLPYNGRRFSDTHSINISPLEIGLPFQIMYMIINRSLELTIAKSKGKIFIIDQAAIPRQEGWDDEKFFYYSEALGYALMNRNQIGVDKSFNQYQVVDMSLYDNIKQLIDLQIHYKQEWDDILGINRQRKGQTYASDLQGVNERAVFQSTIITDMIFNLFEEYTERELQGFLDLSKFTNLDGIRKIWWDTVLGMQLLEVDPDDYCMAELGVFIDSSSEAIARKNKIEANVQAMLQNGAKPSTIVEVLQTVNIADLKEKLREIEDIQAQIDNQMATSEDERLAAVDQRREEFMEYEMMLKEAYMNAEYDRKEGIEDIKGVYNTFTFQDGDSNDNGVPDAIEIQKMRMEKDKLSAKIKSDERNTIAKMVTEHKKLKLKDKELNLKAKDMKEKNAISKIKARVPKKK